MTDTDNLTPEERQCLLDGSLPATSAAPVEQTDAQITTPVDDEIDSAVCGAVRDIYRDFAMRLAEQLTQRMRCETQINDVILNQPSYGEFIFSLEHPTCLQVINEPSCDTAWLMEIHPRLLFPLLDRLLGGGKLPAQIVRRPLTDIENRLVSRITKDILQDLVAAWRPVKDWKPQLDRIEGNPKLVREARPGDQMLTVEIELAFGQNSGPLRIAMSSADVLSIRDSILDPQGPLTDQVTMSISLAEATIGKTELSRLKVGDIVPTEMPPDHLATVYIDGEPKYLGVPGISHGKKAIRIERTIEP